MLSQAMDGALLPIPKFSKPSITVMVVSSNPAKLLWVLNPDNKLLVVSTLVTIEPCVWPEMSNLKDMVVSPSGLLTNSLIDMKMLLTNKNVISLEPTTTKLLGISVGHQVNLKPNLTVKKDPIMDKLISTVDTVLKISHLSWLTKLINSGTKMESLLPKKCVNPHHIFLAAMDLLNLNHPLNQTAPNTKKLFKN